ncbi:MAG: MFS transporter [Gammaproteobacteria bacterium]|nr:MFS transporter [Gammaproteobacteria bacterium]
MFYGWIVLASACLIYFLASGSVFYGMAVVLKPLIEAMGWTRTEGTSGVTWLALSMGLTGPLIAVLIDKIEVRRTIMVGAVAVTAGATTVVFTHSLAQFYFGLVLMGFGVSAQTFIPGGQLVARWFVRRRSLAMGLLMTSAGLGAFIITPAFSLVLEKTGNWQTIFILMALSGPICILASLLGIRNSPEQMGTVPDGAVATASEEQAAAATPPAVYQTPVSWEAGTALRSSVLWALVAIIGMGLLGVNLINSQAVLHLTDLGITQVIAGSTVGLVGLASIFGRLGASALGDHYEPKHVAVVGLFLQAVGFVLLIGANQVWLAYGFAALFGLGMGLAIVSAPLIVMNYFGTTNYAKIMAIGSMATVGVSAFGPAIGGFAYDKLGSYLSVFGGFIALATLLALWLIVIRPPQAPVGAHQG